MVVRFVPLICAMSEVFINALRTNPGHCAGVVNSDGPACTRRSSDARTKYTTHGQEAAQETCSKGADTCVWMVSSVPPRKTALRAGKQANSTDNRILYNIHTFPGHYPRLREAINAWATAVPPANLLIATDTRSPSDPVLPTNIAKTSVFEYEGCPKGKLGHGLGECCKDALSTISALQKGNWDWWLMVDSDHFVNTTAMEEYVGALDPNEPKIYGVPGCGHCAPGMSAKTDTRGTSDNNGMCGGGTYLLSRPMLEKLVRGTQTLKAQETAFAARWEAPKKADKVWAKAGEKLKGEEKAWFEHYMRTCNALTTANTDVVIGCMATAQGYEKVLSDRMHGWRIKDDSEFQDAVEGNPLTFHYVTDFPAFFKRVERAKIQIQKEV